jgi:transcriptional regulator with PAS, ATPase and Fis domain
MFETLKKKLWDLLKEREVSLAMVYDINGDILWHKGRKITGEKIDQGEGFCRSYIRESLKNQEWILKENAVIESAGIGISPSAQFLKVRNVAIMPISRSLFLYIDSGLDESFSTSEIEIFKMLGELLKETISIVKSQENDIGGITGTSDQIKKVKEKVLKYSMVDSPILIHGATGTGKNHVAKLIHQYSGRKGKYKVINVPTLPEAIFESEMFGYKRGAFTDAKMDKRGLVSEAEGGTLHIDEITEIPSSMQAKLLRFIDEKKYAILGELSEREADVRIITSTNKDVKQAIGEKILREDLYFRLNTLEIELPLLKNRKEDIKDLVMEKEHLLKGKKIGKGFWQVLHGYHWPGNVRELFGVIERAGIEFDSPISGKDLQSVIKNSIGEDTKTTENQVTEQIWAQLKKGESFWDVVRKPFITRDISRNDVKRIVYKGLDEVGDKYKNLLKIFNIPDDEYRKFIKFLYKNRLK